MRHIAKSKTARLAAIILAGMAPLLVSAQQDSILVVDPSFEQGYNPVGPHYQFETNGVIAGYPYVWNANIGTAGCLPQSIPYVYSNSWFWNNGGPVDGSYVGFLQNDGIIGQPLSGFDARQLYWTQFYVNEAGNPTGGGTAPVWGPAGGLTNPAVLVVYQLGVNGFTEIVTNIVITPVASVGSNGNDANGTPFDFINVPFYIGATNDTMDIGKYSLYGESNGYSGTAVLLIDGVSVIRRSAQDVTMGNPSFEASGTGQPSPGLVGDTIAGWTTTHPGLRINQTTGPLADNGTIPDGINVLGLVSGAGVSQTLNGVVFAETGKGLVQGENYQLSLYLNSYSGASSPLAVVRISGATAYSNTVAPVGGANAYTFVTYTFTATTNQTLSISNASTTPTNTTLLVDNVRVILLPDSITVADPSFELGDNTTFPYYGLPVPWTWTPNSPGAQGVGADTTVGPYWNNGGAVDQNYVGFIQNDGTLGQPLSGFQVGQNYWLQCFVNAMVGTDTPVLSIVCTASTAGTSPLTNITVTPVDPSGTAGDGVPFTVINVPFTAAATSGTLNFTKVSLSGTDSGNAVLLIDGISVIHRPTNELAILNPSFEASGTGYTYPGYESPIAGWTRIGSPNLIIQHQNLPDFTAPFLDNGVIPEGTNVLGIQSSGMGGVSQMLHGFVPGNPYRLTLNLNDRSSDVPNVVALVTIGGQTAYSGTVRPVGIVYNYYPFHYVSYDFEAYSTDALLQILNESAGGQTLLVDDVHVTPIPSVAPSISAQPVGKTRYASGTVTFTATAQGFPLNYQWTFNGTNIPGATNATLTVTNLQASNVGSYVLHVSNPAGSTNSSPVTVSLLPNFSQYAGNVLANGPMDYWRFNDGETTSAYDYVGDVTISDLDYVALGGTSPPSETNGPAPATYPGFESTNTAPWMDGQTQGYQSTQSLNSGMSNYTMMGWFYIDPTQYPFDTDPFTHVGTVGRVSLFGQFHCGELGFLYDTAEYPSSTTPVLYFYPGTNQTGKTIETTNGWTVGGWNFVAVTINSTTGLAAMYLNGMTVAGIGADTVSGSASTTNWFSIGLNVAYYPEDGYDNAIFPGSIDEVALFNYALSASAIQAIYQSSMTFSVSIAPAAGGLQVSWPAGHLQSTTNLSGPWQDVSGSSPLSVTPTNKSVFYRSVNP